MSLNSSSSFRYKSFVSAYEPNQILSKEEYDEITDIVYDRVKDQLDGQPMFFIEEYEQSVTAPPGEQEGNDEEVDLKPTMVRRRKVGSESKDRCLIIYLACRRSTGCLPRSDR
jgi:hypothetical protein